MFLDDRLPDAIAQPSRGMPEHDPLGFLALWDRICANAVGSSDELVTILLPGLRSIIRKRVNAQDVEDVLHDTVADILVCVRERRVQDPRAFPALARTIALRTCAACIKSLVNNRTHTALREPEELTAPPDAPEHTLYQARRVSAARGVLARLSARDREVLHRFYVEEQSPDEICRTMDITAEQFRNLKFRAKVKSKTIAGRTSLRRSGEPFVLPCRASGL